MIKNGHSKIRFVAASWLFAGFWLLSAGAHGNYVWSAGGPWHNSLGAAKSENCARYKNTERYVYTACDVTGITQPYWNYLSVHLRVTYRDLLIEPGSDRYMEIGDIAGKLIPMESDSSSGKPNSCDASHTPNPVDIPSGNKYFEFSDFVDQGSFPIRFGWSYNSQEKLDTYVRAPAWHYPYSQSIASRLVTPPASSSAVIKREDGRAHSFTSSTLTTFVASDKSIDFSLVRLDGTNDEYWKVVNKGAYEEFYDDRGRLVRIVDLKTSFEQRLTYDGADVTVRHSSGSEIVLHYPESPDEAVFAGFLTASDLAPPSSVTTPVGTFEYEVNREKNNRLERVYYTPSASVGGDSIQRIKLREFKYENPALPFYVTQVLDEMDRVTNIVTYNAQGRATLSRKGTTGESHSLEYLSGSQTRVTNSFGYQTEYNYDTTSKKITTVVGVASGNCDGSIKEFRYDALGRVRYKIDAKGFATQIEYNSDNTVKEVYEGGVWNGSAATFGAGSRYFALEYTADGLLSSLTHNARNSSDTSWQSVAVSRYDYWPNNRLKQLTQTDTTNETTVFGNSNGQQRIWKYDYTYFNGTDLPVDVLVDTLTIDGPLSGTSDKTVYRYNQQGHLLSVTNALNQAVQYSDYNGRGQPQTITDANGVVTTLSYHPRGWLETVTVKAPGGNAALDSVTQYTWYPNGTLEQLTFPDGSFLHYEYNDARHLIEIRNNLDERITFEPNAMGEWTEARTYSASADMRRLQTRAFDELGRLMDLFGNNGQHTHYGYDTNSNLASIVENGTDRTITTTLNHDSLDRLKEVLKPVTTEKNGAPTTVDVNTSYQYDSADNLTRVTDPKGNATRYRYNGFGERIEQTSPDTGVTQYGYNAQGNLSNQRDARGVSLIYHYDLLGRLTRIQYAQTSQDVRYYYDEVDATLNPYAKGRLTRVTDPSGNTRLRYDHRGNLTILVQVIGGKTYATQYRYNLANKLTQIIFPGGRLVNYERNDAMGRVSAVTTQQSATTAVRSVVSGIQYQPFGPITGYVHGNGLTRQVPYDLDYRIDRISVTGTGTTKPLDLTYGYDAFDNIQQMLNGADAARSENFVYDDLHRLQHAYGSYGTNTNHVRYEYDPVGNRTLQAFGQDNQFHTSESYSYSATSNRLNQVTATSSSGTQVRNLQYTAAGNIGSETTFAGAARTHNYNDNNRLINLVENGVTTGTYQQNALGQRVLKTASGKTRHYLYGPQGELLAEASGGTILRYYLYLEGQLVAIVDK